MASDSSTSSGLQERDVLSVLSSFLVEQILLKLEVSDIINCGCVSRQFSEIVFSETLWSRLVEKTWGAVTVPRRWLVDSALGHFELVNCKFPFPGTFRALYPVLREYSQLTGGVWLDPDRNKICVFSWRSSCIQGTELTFSSMSKPPSATPFQSLSADGVCSVHFVNTENCWIKQYKVQEGKLVQSPSQVAHAAATVAVGNYNGDSSSELGCSPKGSFGYEMLRFMNVNVSGKRRKSRSKSPVQCSHHAELAGQYHLKRVPVETPSRAHPFKGLWKGESTRASRGRAEVQVITVVYDFSQRYAVVKAFKVGAGFGNYKWQPEWMASAQASSFPCSARDATLISNRLHYLNLQDAIGAVPLRLAASSSQVPEHDESAMHKQVVGTFRGKGRLGNSEQWCEGRLWQYADGDIGFLWLLPGSSNLDGILIDFKRVDHELPT